MEVNQLSNFAPQQPPQLPNISAQPQAPTKSNAGLIVGILGGTVALGGLGVGAYLLYKKFGSSEVQTPEPQTTQAPQTSQKKDTATQTSGSAQSSPAATQASKSTQTGAAQTTQIPTSTTQTAKTTQTGAAQTTQIPTSTTQTAKTTQTTQTPTKTTQNTSTAPVVPKPMQLYSGDYIIHSRVDPKKDLVVDISGSGKINGTKAIVWSSNGGDNQKFEYINKMFKAKHSGLVLDADGGMIEGRKIQQWASHGGDNQLWVPMDDGTIRAASNDKLCLDVKNNGGEGTDLILWGCNGGNNQKFDFSGFQN